MVSKLPLFLLGTCLFIIPPSLELPDTRADGEDGLDETSEQLLEKLLGAKKARGLSRIMAENPVRSIPENEDRKETVQKVGDGGITRVDVTEKGQIIEQRYRDCDKRNELIVMKPGTPDEECFIHDMDNIQYAYECENKGNRVVHLYQITQQITDKTFLTKAFGGPMCQNVSLSIMEPMKPVDVRGRELKFQLTSRGCTIYCCVNGWWGACANECAACG